LDRFVEVELTGWDAAAAMPLVGDHLDKCPDCRGTFEALRRAVRNT
jgi:predicted anti-sigma-YlaC factor YlaD